MAKFLTKQEIIDKLNSLPDLPVVHNVDWCCQEMVGVRSIEVIDAYLSNYGEYNTLNNLMSEEDKKRIEKLIVIF